MRNYLASLCLAVLTLAVATLSVRAEQTSDYAVQVSATVSKSPPSIQLAWPAPSVTPSGYRIYRKSETDTSFGSPIATIGGTSTSWTDTGVAINTAYEYKIDTNGSYGTGFIFAGIEVPLIEDRGKVVLLVDNTMAQPLGFELTRLTQDLIGDGWTVIRHDIARTASLPSIKQTVASDYSADPNNVKALFIFGHVPVPYSGDLNPDGHSIHKGAWPADTYFANIDGNWSDNSVNDTSATARTDSIQANWNTPGDGKFDQSTLPGDAKLQVGRVDLWNMPTFSASETELLRNYLNKDHNFRVGIINPERRGIVCDNFGTFNGEAFAANGYRAFAPLMGKNITDAVPDENTFVSTLKSRTYLWGDGAGPGYWFSVGNVVTSDDFKNSDPHVVFCMLFGSFFGDWDCQNNVMRSMLATSSTGLATMWAGRPNWYVHHMALGKNIGYTAKLSQNNNGLYPTGSSARGIHVSLLGDPTLRLNTVFPPSNLSGNGSTLSWSGSADGSVLGYHVYRSSSATGPFSRITSSLVTGTSYTDNVSPGTYTYMVRAVKLETSGGGTYFNPSEGAIATINITSGGTPNQPPSITSTASAAPNPATVSQNIAFSVSAQDPDNDPLTYAWDFGDGNTGSTASTNHSYATAGTYNATVSVADNHSHTVTSSVSVTVNAVNGGGGGGGGGNTPLTITTPLAAFPSAPAAGQTVVFTVAASHPLTTYSWDYGDNTHGTSESHVFTAPGTYNVIVNVADAQNNTAFNTLLLTVAPSIGNADAPPVIVTALAATPNPATTGVAVAFTVRASDPDNDTLTYHYDYGDSTSGSNSTHTYKNAGTYTVALTVSDGRGGSVTSSTSVVVTTATAGGGNTGGGTGTGTGLNGGGTGGTDTGGAGTPPMTAPLKLTALAIKLNLKKQNADSISITGVLPVTAGFSAKAALLELNLGTIAQSFTLNDTGAAQSKTASCHVHIKSVKKAVPAQNAPFTITLKGGFGALAANGLDAAHNKQQVTIPVTINFAGSADSIAANVNVIASSSSVSAKLVKGN
jgi:PKD repeat protein